MSDHKRATLTLGQIDLRRFEETSGRLQAVEDDFQEIRAKINLSQHELQQLSLHELQERQQFYNHSIAGLDDHLQAIEQRATQTLLANTTRINAQLNSLGSSLWQDTTQMLQQQFQTIQAVMDENIAQQQAEFAYIHEYLAQHDLEQRQKQKCAQQALNAAQTLLDSVAATYDHERLIPGTLRMLAADLDLAYQNLENDFIEASLVTSQQVYTRTSTARLEMENILLQERLAFNNTITKAQLILEDYERVRQVPAIDLQGEELDMVLDVDYWSWGAWLDSHRSCRRMLTRMQRQRYELDLEQINRMYRIFIEIESKLPEIVSLARTNILASQICYNLAECFVLALGSQGFELFFARYANDDQRQPYVTGFRNLEGSQINVQITPMPKEPQRHTIDLFLNDSHIRTEHEERQRIKALRSALQAYGLQVSAFRNLAETGTAAQEPPLYLPQNGRQMQPVTLQQ